MAGRDHGQDLDEMDRFEETELVDIVAVPGATQVVHALQKHPGAIVTSAWGTLRRRAFKAAGLPVPEVIVPADEIRNGKPDPEGFLRAAELLGIPPEECLVFEDTCPGIKAGVNAGMQIVALLTTVTSHQLNHRPLIRDFRDVAIRAEGDHLKVAVTDAISFLNISN